MKSKLTSRAALALAFYLTAGTLFGQTTTGTVSGAVADNSGARVPGATVRIVNVETRDTRTTTANNTGDYLFPSVPTGQYELQAEATGFKTERRAGIRLDVNQNARVDFTLQVGQATEVIQV